MKKWLPVIVALSMNLLPISAFAGCGGAGNFPGGDNCELVGGGYQGAPGPIIGGDSCPARHRRNLAVEEAAQDLNGHRPQVSRFGLRPLGMKLEWPFYLDG